jgi:SAM-dependent methyltransferase
MPQAVKREAPAAGERVADGQSAAARDRNARFFLDNLATYGADVGKLDSYRNIRQRVSREVAGIGRLLDIGNGGVFDYDTAKVREIVALDLFFDQVPAEIAAQVFPPNVTTLHGSALAIPAPDESFDGVLMVMLIHHLVGDSVAQSIANARAALAESWRVLRPGGRLIIAESCVPGWFYAFERAVFSVAAAALKKTISHPHTKQYSVSALSAMLHELDPRATSERVDLCRWVLLYGFRCPAVLTPVRVHLFTATKPER